MSIDVERLLSDNNVDFKTNGAEVTRGWVNMQCPFCGDTKHHLGYNQSLDMFSCWKCGRKDNKFALSRVLNTSTMRAEQLIKEYYIAGSEFTQKIYNPKKKLHLPDNFGTLKREHKKYLKSRKFNPIELRKQWGLVGSDDTDYQDRIIIPIYYKGRLVSFHTRTIDEHCPKQYKAIACPKHKEVVPFKHTLYGFDNVVGNTVILVEGPADVWRFGYGAVCTFGIKFTEEQLSLLSSFANIFIMFDNKEKVAQKQAEKLADSLSIFNDVWVIDDYGNSDPAELSYKKAEKIKQSLFDMAKENDSNK